MKIQTNRKADFSKGFRFWEEQDRQIIIITKIKYISGLSCSAGPSDETAVNLDNQTGARLRGGGVAWTQ